MEDKEIPVYEYACFDCGHEFEVVKVKYEPDEIVICQSCARDATLRVSVPNIQPDVYWNGGKYDETLGAHFNSKSEHKRYMKQRGIEDADSGTPRIARSARKERRDKADAVRRDVIGSTVRDMVI